MKSWHISTSVLAVSVIMIFVFSAGGNESLGAGLLLALLGVLPWWGWTLNDRSKYKYEQIETRLREQITSRDPDVIITKRRSRVKTDEIPA